ncbi:hypothetical protein [Kitasatospora sp. GP82]|uniref:hypothetical protein n=1 Tax=Kitasatospora sp. GP82 TaxID=3035089 RepID=UPI00247BE94B|nr:signal transduction histidine kinase [Kitasatospora sp. GP82]
MQVRATALEPAAVAGSELLLGRLVRNLLDNACRCAATEVLVSLRTEAGVSGADRARPGGPS